MQALICNYLVLLSSMATSSFKMESGLQLLARLRNKPVNENFYPALFVTGLKTGEVTELYSDESMSCLLADIISEALIPESLYGVEFGVLLLNTDGNLSFDLIVNVLKKKLSILAVECQDMNSLLQQVLQKLKIIEVYDSTQFYTTLHNFENILMENQCISLVIFDTLTAFYWSEQGLKITKMDIYLKSLLTIVQKITKEFNIKIMYTRPEYFSSSKDCIENLEACSKQPKIKYLNYRMQVMLREDDTYQVRVRTSDEIYNKYFSIVDDTIKWI